MQRTPIADPSKLFIVRGQSKPLSQDEPHLLIVTDDVQYTRPTAHTQAQFEQWCFLWCTLAGSRMPKLSEQSALLLAQHDGTHGLCEPVSSQQLQALTARLIVEKPTRTKEPSIDWAVQSAVEWTKAHWALIAQPQREHWKAALTQVQLRGQQMVDEAPQSKRAIVAQRVHSALVATHESEQLLTTIRPVALFELENSIQTHTHTLSYAQGERRFSATLRSERNALLATERWPVCESCRMAKQSWSLCMVCQSARCVWCARKCRACHWALCVLCTPSVLCVKCGLPQVSEREMES